MRYLLFCMTVCGGLVSTLRAETILIGAASAGAYYASEWSSIPRLPDVLDDIEGQSDAIWNKACQAVILDDIERALVIQQNLFTDLEVLESKHGKQKYGAALATNRQLLTEIKTIHESSKEVQAKYRLSLIKLYECKTALHRYEFDKSAASSFEGLEPLQLLTEGKFSLLLIIARHNHAALLMAAGNPELALGSIRLNAEELKAQFGDMHPRYLDAIGNLGDILLDMKEYAQAELYEREYLNGVRVHQTTKSLDYARGLASLATALIGQQKYIEAEALSLHSAAILKALKLEHRHSMARCHRNLGEIAMAQGEYKQAEDYFDQAMLIYKVAANSSKILSSGCDSRLQLLLGVKAENEQS
jgi:tetratricopeptide (TPR) repeat protein